MSSPLDDESTIEALVLAALDEGITLHLRPVDVAAVAWSAIDAQLRACGASITLRSELAAGLPLALADEARLQEAIELVLGHVIDHGRGGVITVRVFCGAARIQVAVHHDHGISDRGFGLLMCRAIIESQGGALLLTPSTATITVPVAP